jgi:hypothetical protein
MIILLLLLNICHWVADYTQASTPWMLKAKRTGAPVLPIAAHAAVHALLMGTVCYFVAGPMVAALCFVIQWTSHLLIDILKGRCNVWKPSLSNPANVYHWWVFGADQFLHQSVIILIAAIATP